MFEYTPENGAIFKQRIALQTMTLHLRRKFHRISRH